MLWRTEWYFPPNVSEVSYEIWLWFEKTSVSQTSFPSSLFVGPEGGVCKVENQSVWLGTTEPGAQHPVPAARQTSFWCASSGMCLCGKWPLLPTCSQQELAYIQSWPASPRVRYSAPKSQSLAISDGVIKMECLSNPQLLEAAFLQRTASPRWVHGQKEDQTVSPGLGRCHRHS